LRRGKEMGRRAHLPESSAKKPYIANNGGSRRRGREIGEKKKGRRKGRGGGVRKKGTKIPGGLIFLQAGLL